MNWSKITPCDTCPFKIGTSMVLLRERAQEIAEMMLSFSGGTFPCHKTVDYDEDGNHAPKDSEIHCAGALIFAELNGNQTQMMRIAERIGLYDHRKLMAETNPAVAQVFKTKRAFVKCMTRAWLAS